MHSIAAILLYGDILIKFRRLENFGITSRFYNFTKTFFFHNLCGGVRLSQLVRRPLMGVFYQPKVIMGLEQLVQAELEGGTEIL
jgi:hypothetical protein